MGRVPSAEEEGAMSPWIWFAQIVTGLIGGGIGARKGYLLLGCFLGVFLSVIGLVIIAVVKPSKNYLAQ
jgi:hypothetical protein